MSPWLYDLNQSVWKASDSDTETLFVVVLDFAGSTNLEVLNNENKMSAAKHTPSTEGSHSSAVRNPSEEDFQR